MSRLLQSTVFALSLLSQVAWAKTDLAGCTSFTSTVTVRPEPGYGNTYQTVIWFVPDTLEICAGVDCGGGRAPPKTVPGCPAYTGTETVKASFLATNPFAPPPPTSTSTPPAPDTSGSQGGSTGPITTTSAPSPPASTSGSTGPSSSGATPLVSREVAVVVAQTHLPALPRRSPVWRPELLTWPLASSRRLLLYKCRLISRTD
jgi:hypothetical protein